MSKLIATAIGHDGDKLVYPGEPVQLVLEKDKDGKEILPSWVKYDDGKQGKPEPAPSHPLLDQHVSTVKKAIEDGDMDVATVNALAEAENARENPRNSILAALDAKKAELSEAPAPSSDQSPEARADG